MADQQAKVPNNIPLIDGSKFGKNPEEAKSEAYQRLMQESDRINSILKDSFVVNKGEQGLPDVPDYVDEVGDSIARSIDFEGKDSTEPSFEDVQPKGVDDNVSHEETPQETFSFNEEELSSDEKNQLEREAENFRNDAHQYEQVSRDNLYHQMEAERAHLLQRQQEMESELAQLRKIKEDYEEENLKNWEEKVLESINIANDRGERDKAVVLLRELSRIDRVREKRKEQQEQAQTYHPFTQPTQVPMNQYASTTPQPYLHNQGLPPGNYGMPYNPYNPYAQVPQPIQHHPLVPPTPSSLPAKVSSSAPSTAAPKAKGRVTSNDVSNKGKIHPFAKQLIQGHPIPPGMKLEEYYDFYLEHNKNI